MKFTSYTQFYRDREQYGIEYAAEHAAALGFDSVEYFGHVPSGVWKDVEQDQKALKRHGLCVTCYSVLAQLFTSDQNELKTQMFREIETAAALGSSYFHHTLFPPYSMAKVSHSYEEVFDGIVDLTQRVAEKCNQLGIVCLYEPQGVYFNGIDGLGRMYEQMKRRGVNVGICGDFGNSLFVDTDPKEIFRHFAGDIRHVHVKDYVITDIEDPQMKQYQSLSGKLIYDTAVGEGVVDFAYGFGELKKIGYDGAISFELEGSDEEIRRALRFIKNTIRGV